MTARSPGAFFLSALFHALIVGLILLFSMEVWQQKNERPRILELVAGEGDNYGATVAPKLGTPGGLKIDVPTPPTPKVAPEPEPEPVPPAPAPKVIEPEPEPAPVPAKSTPAPTVPAVQTKQAEKKQLTPKQQLLRKVWAAQDRGKKEAAKERAAEEKRLKKEEFDRMQRDKARATASARSASPKVSHIDGEGIAKGVVGGSAENKTGGAGGRALTRDLGSVLEAYDALLKQRVQAAIDKPPGVSDNLTVTVVVHIAATGRLSNARVVTSSGSDEFDRAVIAAFGRVNMPEHPEHRGEDVELEFRTKDAGQ